MRGAVAAGVPWTRRRANPNGGNWNRYRYRSSSRPESVLCRQSPLCSFSGTRAVRASPAGLSERESEAEGGGIECIVYGL